MPEAIHNIKYDVFLAHSDGDLGFATKLYRILKPHYSVFLAAECLRAGDRWDVEIARALREAFVTVILISAHTESSFYEQEEIAAAIDLSRGDARSHRVVPVYLSADALSESMPYGLRRLQSLTKGRRGVKEIGDAIVSLLRELNVPARAESVERVDISDAANHDIEKPLGDDTHLIEILEAVIQKTDKSAALTLALVDIDNQTAVNRRFGPQAGDQVISYVEELLRAANAGLMVGRSGADSFYVIFENAIVREIRARMNRLKAEVQRFDWQRVATDLFVTCSIGIAERMLGEDSKRWLSRAGRGVRFAKVAGGNRIEMGPRFLPEDYKDVSIS